MIDDLIRVREQIETLETAIKTLRKQEEAITEEIVANSFGAKTIKTDSATITIDNRIFASIKGGQKNSDERKKLADIIRTTEEVAGEYIENLDYISDARLSQWCKNFPTLALQAKENGLINIEVKKKIILRKK